MFYNLLSMLVEYFVFPETHLLLPTCFLLTYLLPPYYWHTPAMRSITRTVWILSLASLFTDVALLKPMLVVASFKLWIFFARTLDRLSKGIRTAARDALLSKISTPSYKRLVTGLTLFAIANSSDVFLLLKAKQIGGKTTTPPFLHISYTM